MSEVVRLSIVYDSDEPTGPFSLVAKFPPRDAQSRQHGVDLGFFEGECGFYRELARRSAVPAPRCYFTRYDSLTGSFLTLLQDLSEMRLGDISAGCSREECARAIDILARLHASWWNKETLADYDWLRSRAGRLAEIAALIPTAWPLFVSRFGSSFEPEQLEILSMVEDLSSGLQGALLSRPWTLLHGDFKLDNLFFESSGEITVADWGLVMTGPPMYDVATLLGINLSSAERRYHEVGLVKAYTESLLRNGVDGYGLDQALHDYKLQLFGLLPQFIGAGGLATFADAQAMQEYAGGVQRVLAAVIDHRVIDLLAGRL